MDISNRCFKVIRGRTLLSRLIEIICCECDKVSIPERAILLFELNNLTVGVEPGFDPCGIKQHERMQRQRLFVSQSTLKKRVSKDQSLFAKFFSYHILSR